MKSLRKPLLQVMVLTLLFSMFIPLPAVAASKVFEVTKSGNQNILNDTSDPSIDVNFSGYSLNEEDYSYRMVVFDKFNGETRKIEHCGVEDCSFYLNSVTGLVEAGHHEYFAVIDQADNSYSDFTIEDEQVQSLADLDNPIYTSASLKTIMERPTISLSSNTNYFTNDIFAESNESDPALELKIAKPVIAEDYAYYTFDMTNDKLTSIETNFASPINISTPTNMNNDHVTFQTFQAKWDNHEDVEQVGDLQDIKEVSNTVTLTRRPWIVPKTGNVISDYDIELTTGGGNKTHYHSHASTGEIIYENGTPKNSSYYTPDPTIVITVADPWSGSMPTNVTQLTGVKANSEGIRDIIEKPGLESKEQVAGGSNPSENCPQNCGGDPINFYSGEFFENSTDLTMAGAGITPSVGRSYSTQRKSELSNMGYGWRSNYGMKIQSANDEPLSTSNEIKVIQENSSASFFTRNSDGTYSAGDKVKAKLSKASNGKYVLVRDLRTTFTFSSAGKLEKVEDLNGSYLNLTYIGNNLTSVADGNGNTLTYAYNADNLISQVAANNGRSVNYSYNAKRLMRAINENGVAFDYTYDTTRRVKTLKDALGGITENFYDANNRIIRQDDPYGKRLRFAYAQNEGLNQETTITYPNGRIVVETYQDGALTRKIENPDTTLEKKWYYSYDANNNLLSSVAPDGSHSNSTYDSRGNLLTHRNELGGVSTFTYDALNNVLTATNPLGKTSVNTYDSRGNLLSTVDPLGAKTTYEWSLRGILRVL